MSYKRENPQAHLYKTGLLLASLVSIALLSYCLQAAPSPVVLAGTLDGSPTTLEGSPDFHAAYEMKEKLGCGMQGCTWNVTKREDKSGTTYVAKIYQDWKLNSFFEAERDAMLLIGTHDGYSNLIDSFQDEVNGSVLVENYIGGIKLSEYVNKIPNELITREFLLDILEKQLERVAYLHDSLYMMHRDLHYHQWFVQEDGSLILTDFSLAVILGKDGFVPAGDNTTGDQHDCLSPERTLQELYSFNSDVWMIGCWNAIGANTIFHNMDYRDGTWPKYATDYSIQLSSKTENRAMPLEYGLDYNHLIQWMLTYDQWKRPQTSQVLNKMTMINF